MKFATHLRRLTRLPADTRGMSTIETVAVIPALALMVAGMSDVAMGYSAKLKMQQAANRTAALATVAGPTGSTATVLQSEAAAAAGVTSNQVTVDRWLECAGIRQASFDDTCFSGQQVARFVSVTINGSYQPRFPMMRYLMTSTLALRGFSAVRLQ